MNAGAAKLAGQAVQKAFPFMKDAALKSSKADQTWHQMMQMGEMVGAGGAQAAKPQPWQQFVDKIRGFRGGPNVEVNPMRPLGRMNDPSAPMQSVKFSLEPKGGGSQWHGGFKPDSQNPFEMYVEHLTSDASRRKSVGGGDTGMMETYRADISSPAQKDWGWGKPKPSKQPGREARSPEDRVSMDEFRNMRQMGYHQPGPSMSEKTGLIDKLLGLARDSGFKSMAFSAEPGERPRLYSRLMGYDFKPVNESPLDQMSRMLSGFPGRQGRPTQAPEVPAYGIDRARWAAGLNEQTPLTVPMLENALMLSVDEAVDMGLAVMDNQRGIRLTRAGIDDIRNALREMGADF